MNNKLNGKDLVNIGIFAAIYFVINMQENIRKISICQSSSLPLLSYAQ